jgi:hypothetical protein
MAGGLCILHCHDIRDVWQSGITLTLPLVENFARDEIAGPSGSMTRRHAAALSSRALGRGTNRLPHLIPTGGTKLGIPIDC